MPKLLFVDDDRTTVRMMQTLLELDGFEVRCASSGHEAVSAAREFLPDLVMMDFHLVDMSGIELIAQLRQIEALAKTPMVLASGMDKEVEARAAGASLFLVKPFEPSRLADQLLKLLG